MDQLEAPGQQLCAVSGQMPVPHLEGGEDVVGLATTRTATQSRTGSFE